MGTSVELFGRLIGGIIGNPGETTGFILAMGNLDLDASAVHNIPDLNKKRVLVAGDLEERTYPLRGRVRILRAREIVEEVTPGRPNIDALSRNGLRSSVFFSGTLHTPILRPGSEGPGSELFGITPEIDVSGVKTDGLIRKAVMATGRFELAHYTERGTQFVFKATALKATGPKVSFSARAEGADAQIVQVHGVSTKFSLEDAIMDAVRHLPMADIAFDWLTQVHVDSIDADFGGFAGVSLLKVTISAAVPKLIPKLALGGGGQPEALLWIDGAEGGGGQPNPIRAQDGGGVGNG
jgi:hypothetical protein